VQRGDSKVKVRLRDEEELIELFSVALKERITVALDGPYPEPNAIQQELQAAYDRQREYLENQSD
jgi:hypothetical protein